MFRWHGAVLLKRWCAVSTVSASSASLRHSSGSKTPANVTPYDCRTWPRTMTAAEIEELLKDAVKPGARVYYDGLEYALANQKLDSIDDLLRGKLYEPMPKEVDVEKLISSHVENTASLMSMPLVDRDSFLSKLQIMLWSSSSHSWKPWLVYAYAMRGSGKTQVLKHAVHKLLLDRAKIGRVIVRCCEKSADSPWMIEARAGRSGRALCELIAEHLREVVGPTQVAATVEEAYAEWYIRTKEHFGMDDATSTALCMEPIIMLDTCEMLATVAVQGERHGMSTSKRFYNALELLATSMPAPHRMVAIGCNADVEPSGRMLTQCNLVALPTLTPIRHEHHAEAVRAWGQNIDASVQDTVYLLTGGLPRLLRLAHERKNLGKFSRTSCSVGAPFTSFDDFVAACNSHDPIGRVDVAYCCYLASITRWAVHDVKAVVPMPPGSAGENTTFKQAIEFSLGMYDAEAKVFVMPPVLGKQLGDFVVPGVILPRPGDLCPLDIVPDLAKNGGSIARGIPFEKVFLHALHARYLLCFWSRKSADGWVELADVLQGALSVSGRERIAGLQVNLAGGVCDANAESYDSFSALSNGQARTIQWNREQPTALHDAYIRCRQGSAGRLVTVPIQIRHGTSKAPGQLASQLPRSGSKKERDIKIDVLLLVSSNKTSLMKESEGLVCVRADAMVAPWSALGRLDE